MPTSRVGRLDHGARFVHRTSTHHSSCACGSACGAAGSRCELDTIARRTRQFCYLAVCSRWRTCPVLPNTTYHLPSNTTFDSSPALFLRCSRFYPSSPTRRNVIVLHTLVYSSDIHRRSLRLDNDSLEQHMRSKPGVRVILLRYLLFYCTRRSRFCRTICFSRCRCAYLPTALFAGSPTSLRNTILISPYERERRRHTRTHVSGFQLRCSSIQVHCY